MPYTEVIELRKNGQLDEALELAYSLLENEENVQNYRALFWVLYDKCKQNINEGAVDEAKSLLAQLHETLDHTEEDQDSPAVKQLEILERRVAPLNQTIRQADQDSRNVHTVEQAFSVIKSIIENEENELDDFQQTSAAWVLYRYAKHELEGKATYNVRCALSLYFKLNVEKPSPVHSSILRIAVDLEKQFNKEFKFTAFFKMWGFDNLMDEDWERFTTDEGNRLPSLAEKAIGRYCKELKDDNINTVPDEFVQLIETARHKVHDDGKLELNYARVLAAKGERERAVEVYRAVTEKIPQAYVWQEMANIIDDRDIKQAILCKVITMQRQEQFLGDTRLQLAQQLIEDGDFAAAKLELETYHHARQQNQWSTDRLYYELSAKIPAGTQESDNNSSLYASKQEKLISFLYPDAKTAVMVYNGKPFTNKKNKQCARLVASDDTSVQILLKRLPRHPSRQHCYFYTVKYIHTSRGAEALNITPLDSQEGMSHFDVVNGELRIKTKPDGKRFGFVGNCYVGQNLLGTLAEGQRVQAITIKRQDGKLSAAAIIVSNESEQHQTT